jgi:hypothetical protein
MSILKDTNQKQLKNLKINLEKRRSHKFFNSLNYFNPFLTPVDFFSNDVLKLIKYAFFLQKHLNLKELTFELLLIVLLTKNNQILKFLEKKKITKIDIYNLFFLDKIEFLIENKKKKSLFKKLYTNLIEYNASSKKIDLIFSFELSLLFQKALKNSYQKFKTFNITPEILLITFLEESKNSSILKFQNLFLNSFFYNLFLYEIYKLIYLEEKNTKKLVPKQKYLFLYFLKKFISQKKFLKLIETKNFKNIIFLFRNLFISKVIKKDIFFYLKKDIFYSNKILAKRQYS